MEFSKLKIMALGASFAVLACTQEPNPSAPQSVTPSTACQSYHKAYLRMKNWAVLGLNPALKMHREAKEIVDPAVNYVVQSSGGAFLDHASAAQAVDRFCLANPSRNAEDILASMGGGGIAMA